MTILNNCGCLITLGINETNETAPYLSKRIGEASIEVVSKSESVVADKARSLMSKQSTGVGKRAFLSVAEICELSRDGSILLFADHQPVYANKFPYILHPDAEKLEDTLPADVIDFSDRAARQVFREAEEAYRQRFWNTHEMHPDMKYKDLNDALFTDPPQSPIAMVLNMLRDDWSSVRKKGKRLIIGHIIKDSIGSFETEEGLTPLSGVQNGNMSAEKGAFGGFYEEYRKKNGAQNFHYSNLSSEIRFSADSCQSVQCQTATVSPAGKIPEEPVKAEQRHDAYSQPASFSGQAVQHRSRSLKSISDMSSIALKEIKEPQVIVGSGNLPKARVK